MNNLESNIQAIIERNKQKELDKAWEMSLLRRGFIALVTYGASYIFMTQNSITNPEVQACIPTGGYILSTLSLPWLKRW